jgi:hypothetical protein
MATTTLDYLITDLRLHLGDYDPASYRYTDAWLLVALIASVKTLGRWWNFKYLVETDNDVYRNPGTTFILPEPPVIEVTDERPIILMASIIIKEGSLEANSWNAGSWRDFEVSYSNIEGSRAKMESLNKDWEELKTLVTPPSKKLSTPLKQSLPGYKGNIWERGTDL